MRMRCGRKLLLYVCSSCTTFHFVLLCVFAFILKRLYIWKVHWFSWIAACKFRCDRIVCEMRSREMFMCHNVKWTLALSPFESVFLFCGNFHWEWQNRKINTTTKQTCNHLLTLKVLYEANKTRNNCELC